MSEKRVLRLGYVETDYPYVTECAVSPGWKTCRAPGINMVIWRELAFQLNYEFVFVKSKDYGAFVDGQWTGLMGELYNGTVDASLTLLVISHKRWNGSRFSVPIIMGEFGLARGQQSESDEYQFHVFVFSPLVLLCLFISILLVGSVVAYRVRSVHGYWDAFSLASHKDRTARHFKNPLIILAFLVILLAYQAGANSQRITLKTSSRKSNLASIQKELMSGISQLLLAYPSVMGEDNVDRLMQRSHGNILDLKPTLEPDEERRIARLCGSSNFIKFGELRGLLSSKFLPHNCVLERIQLSDTFDKGGPMGFGFARNFSNARLQQINAIIGRIFTTENMEEYWFRQYHYYMVETRLFSDRMKTLSAVTLHQLRFGYAFFAAAAALSCIAFAVEKYSLQFCVNINCAFIRIGRSRPS